MTGPLLTEMREMNRLIIGSGGYETDINMKSDTDPVVDKDTLGLVTFHHLGVDPETGQEISSRQIHILVNVKILVDLGYPVFRDEKLPDDPDFLDDIVEFIDANGKLRKVKVIDQRPSNTFGCSLLFVEDIE